MSRTNLAFYFVFRFRIYARERRPGSYVVTSATVMVVSVSSNVYNRRALVESTEMFDEECAIRFIPIFLRKILITDHVLFVPD